MSVTLESMSTYTAKDSKASMVSSLTGKYNKIPQVSRALLVKYKKRKDKKKKVE